MTNPQFSPPAGKSRKAHPGARAEFGKEERRLDRRAPRTKKPEKKSYYERQLEKYGFPS